MDERKPDPCPFCGSEDVHVVDFYVKCNGCGVWGPDGDDKQAAIALWNKAPRS